MESADSQLSSLRALLDPSVFGPARELARNVPQLSEGRLRNQPSYPVIILQAHDIRVEKRWTYQDHGMIDHSYTRPPRELVARCLSGPISGISS